MGRYERDNETGRMRLGMKKNTGGKGGAGAGAGAEVIADGSLRWMGMYV